MVLAPDGRRRGDPARVPRDDIEVLEYVVAERAARGLDEVDARRARPARVREHHADATSVGRPPREPERDVRARGM